jgi:hypothetical protein
MSFWLSLRELTPYSSTLRLLTTCVSTLVIMPDAKKRDRFCRGLNTKLKDHLNPIRADTYNELVNLAVTQEDCIMAHRAEKKRKAPTGLSSAPPQRYRTVQNASSKGP